MLTATAGKGLSSFYTGKLGGELRKLKTGKEEGKGQEPLQSWKEVGWSGRQRDQPSMGLDEEKGESALWG